MVFRVIRFKYSDLSVTHDKCFRTYCAAQRYIDKLYKECGSSLDYGISIFEGRLIK